MWAPGYRAAVGTDEECASGADLAPVPRCAARGSVVAGVLAGATALALVAVVGHVGHRALVGPGVIGLQARPLAANATRGEQRLGSLGEVGDDAPGDDAGNTTRTQTTRTQTTTIALTVGTDNCNVTRHCAAPGTQCYEQTPLYAQCRVSCIPGRDPTHWDGVAWSCRALGPRRDGEEQCTKMGADCRQGRCCQTPGQTCYEKDATWAACRDTCQPGPDFHDTNGKPWSCKKLGPTRLGAAAWVANECAAGSGSNCLAVGCCRNAGEQCFKKDAWYGECRAACDLPGWNCEAVGARTPATPRTKNPPAAMPPWAFGQCSGLNQGCSESRCCLGMDVQCYEKDSNWAQCRSECVPGAHADDNNGVWSCNKLGPRSYGMSTKGFPSLYCFAVIRTNGYEVGLVGAQAARWVGIFACDEQSLLTADGTITIGTTTSIRFPGAPVGISVDNTAGNTKLFVNAWAAVVNAGVWRRHTFTLKADPDAVVLPDRIRAHLLPHVGEKMFVINCPWGDMIFGALEVFSYHAILEWSTRGRYCPVPANWGEDKYMTHCMDYLGVSRVHDISILADNLCLGSDCSNPVAGAFHPYKNIGAWLGCWETAKRQSKSAAVVGVQIRK